MVESATADAEQAVLAALMVDDDAWDEVADVFRPSLFATPAHRHIAEAFASLRQARQPTDIITVQDRLESRGLLGSSVPRDLPMALSRAAGTAGNVRYYVEVLQDQTVRRQLDGLAQKMLADKTGTGAEKLARVARALSEIELRRDAPAVHVSEVVMEVWNELEGQHQAAKSGQAPEQIWSTGYAELDQVLGGISPACPVIFAARPSKGKSALATCLLDNLASAGVPVGAFWLEDRRKKLVKRVLMRRALIGSMLMRHGGRLKAEHFDRLATTGEAVSKLPIYIDDSHDLTALEISHRMRRMARKFGVKVFFFDHLGEVALDDSSRRDDQKLGDAARRLRDTGDEIGAAVVMFHQMNRGIERRGENATPQLSDLDDSGKLEQVARVVAFLSRPGADTFRIDVLKNTEGPAGVKVELAWLGDYMAVENAGGAKPKPRYIAEPEEAA